MRALKGDTTYAESAKMGNRLGTCQQQQTGIYSNPKQPDTLEEKDCSIAFELKSEILELKQQLMKAKDQVREYDQKIIARDRNLRLLTQQYEASEQARLELEKRLLELKIRTQHSEGSMNLRLIWREGHKIPREISKGCDPVVRNNVVYFKPASNVEIYAYDTINHQWSQLPNCVYKCCSLTVIKNQLTTIGGCQHHDNYSNELFSFTGETLGRHSDRGTCSWTSKEFPPMKTRRCNTTTLCTETYLIVAGGVTTDRKVLKTVEVMNLDTCEWTVAADIPIPLYSASLLMNDDRLYMVGGSDKDGDPVQTVFWCSMINLLPHGKKTSNNMGLKKVWKKGKIADIPVTDTTCVLVQGRLLTIGGMNWDGRTTTAVHTYDPLKRRWIVISHMSMPRSECFVAFLSEKNELLVAGGYTEKSFAVCNLTDDVEVAIAVS